MQMSPTELTVIASIIILIILSLWVVPKWQLRSLKRIKDDERFKIENEARKVMAEIFGGTFILIGLFFTWQTVRSTNENLRITQEGQITDRFTRAIDQLGKADEAGKASNLAIRLGGIRGLERLAGDSDKDYWPIIDVLTTYIRQNAFWREGGKDQPLDQVLAPPSDIQAILSALGRRNHTYGSGESQRLDLSGTDLRKATLNEGKFQGVDLTRARLDGARLKGIHLEQADLTGANFTSAVLDQAHLEGADLTGAILDKAILTGANLKRVVGLTQEQIKSAITDSKTQLP